MKARKAYKFRIYPTRAQIKNFEHTLDLCRELYNAALQERRDAYKMCRISISFNAQCEQLPAIKEVRPDICEVYSQVLQDVLHRVDKTFKAFFARCKRGETPGFPRFQGKHRYASFTYPQLGWSLKNNKLTLSKIGTVALKLHREVIGKVKTCSIIREGDSWFVCFSLETEFEPPVHTGPAVGIDVGLEHFANLSDGTQIENPRFLRKSEKRLAKVQRKLAKLQHLPRRNPKKLKAKKAVNRVFRKIRNQRLDFAHKLSSQFTKLYSLIAVEDLNVKGLAASRLAKSVNDAAWSMFTTMLAYKVENTGSQLVKVDPRQTSQRCPECGATRKKELSERWHSCPCGSEMQRDIAAACVILSRGLATVRNQSVEAAPL